MSSPSWRNRRKVIRELKKITKLQNTIISEVQQTALNFATLLREYKFGKETLEDLIDEVYKEVPEIENDKFWHEVDEQFGACLVSELVIDTLADHLQEQFNRQFNGTDLEFDTTGDIIKFLATEPGKICANLPNEVTVGDLCEFFVRLAGMTFGRESIGESDINIYALVAEGMRDMVVEGEMNIDSVMLDGSDMEDFVHEWMIPILENTGAMAFLLFQSDDDAYIEDSGENDTQL